MMAGAAVGIWMGCTSPVGTSSHTVVVENTTSGDDQPSTPYPVKLQAGHCCDPNPLDPPLTATMALNAAVSFRDLGPGYFWVMLQDVPPNCGVTMPGGRGEGFEEGESSYRSSFEFKITGSVATIPYDIDCHANRIAVKTTTTGTPQDGVTAYAVAVDDGTPFSIALNDQATVKYLSDLNHTVTLSGVPANCAVTPANPATVTVTQGQTAAADFTITCAEAPVADAGADQQVDVGTQVTLDGSASTGTIQTYQWQLIHQSGESKAPGTRNSETFTFTLDEPDSLEYELTVSAGTLSDKDRAVVRSNPPTITGIAPANGPVGTSVTITGTNFSPTASRNEVRFNGVLATVTGAGVTELVAEVPANATTGPVSVTVLGTGDVVIGPEFTVDPTPASPWERLDSGLDQFHGLYAVDVVDANTAYAVGERGAVVRTTDGGTAWETRTPPGANWLLRSVDFVDAQVGTVVGTDVQSQTPKVARTEDGGATWTEQDDGIACGGPLAVTFSDAQTGWMVGGGCGGGAPGSIMHTSDGGTTWVEQPNTVGQELWDVASVSAQVVVAVGEGGVILRTDDAGSTWTQVASGTGDRLERVSFAPAPDQSYGAAVSRSGAFLRTTDGGATWTLSTVQVGMRDVATPSASVVVLVGDDEAVLRSEDGGASWTQETVPQEPGTSNRGTIYGVSFGSPTAGMAVEGAVTQGNPTITVPILRRQ
jgi:photosystem II stability/assembly factor-like uncharacterized protein